MEILNFIPNFKGYLISNSPSVKNFLRVKGRKFWATLIGNIENREFHMRKHFHSKMKFSNKRHYKDFFI